MRKCERNNPADAKFCEQEWGGGTPGTVSRDSSAAHGRP